MLLIMKLPILELKINTSGRTIVLSEIGNKFLRTSLDLAIAGLRYYASNNSSNKGKNQFDGGVLFHEVNFGLNVMWKESFNSDGSVDKENAAFLIPDGLLVLPNSENTQRSSKISILPLVSRTDASGNRNLFVKFGPDFHQILGVIHTHPNGNPYPTPKVDFQLVKQYGIQSFIMSEPQIREAYIDSRGNEKSRRIGSRNALWPFN